LHHHPVVDINDRIDCSLRGTPSYLLAEVDGFAVSFPETTSTTRIFFVPAFYEFAGGLNIHLILGNKISSFAKTIKTNTIEVFLKDGAYVDTWDGLTLNRRMYDHSY
jgi:metallophosphoesterase superfamily enzyme